MVPLALFILAPIVVNIVAFHLFLAPGGVTARNRGSCRPLFFSAYAHRRSFESLLSTGTTQS